MAENDNDLAKSMTSADVSGSLRKATFINLEEGARTNPDFNEIDLVMDVPVQVTVELGRAKMQIRNLLNLTYGSVIELDIRKFLPNICVSFANNTRVFRHFVKPRRVARASSGPRLL